MLTGTYNRVGIPFSAKTLKLVQQLEKLASPWSVIVNGYDSSPEGRVFVVYWIHRLKKPDPMLDSLDNDQLSAVAWGHDLQTALRRAVLHEEELRENR